ncbi:MULTISPECIES: nucleoid-associated protein [Clostridium]|uniref:Nucleoid-associated protein n=1 Tax=Clostridium senegalense TaxID=1465809 RepID=A0A6M0H0N6_9CLOT|nr:MULTISPECIES: nucleoid-associated protein [Clostridium]NEU03768.1 nucleoid-associated protein [Clostridium senegalense]
MQYIKEINIIEAVIHVLDNNSDEPVLNEFALELNDEIYAFLMKHIQRCLKDEELKYAFFSEDRNIVKELSQEFLNGENNIINVSKEFAKQMFMLMRSKGNIPSCDLVTVSFTTEYGLFICIFKMDYIKNYMHTIEYVDNKIGIDIIPQFTGLPSSSSRIQKCAFIKTINADNEFDLMIIDKQSKNKNAEDYGSNYFIDNFLGCKVIDNERDMTKNFVKIAEKWTKNNFNENASDQEKVRSHIKQSLKEENIDLNQFSEEAFKDNDELKESFKTFAKEQGVSEKITVDKEWVEKKLKRIRLKIDKDLDLYISEEAYRDLNRFEIKRNGDGSINMILKHIMNYEEK